MDVVGKCLCGCGVLEARCGCGIYVDFSAFWADPCFNNLLVLMLFGSVRVLFRVLSFRVCLCYTEVYTSHAFSILP